MSAPVLTRHHRTRLLEVWRSAGWPCLDGVEIDLLAAGLLERCTDECGRTLLRLTDAGIAHLAEARRAGKRSESLHDRMALAFARQQLLPAGRVVWRELSLRAALEAEEEPPCAADGAAPAGGAGLARGHGRALPAGAGTHRHRQDGGHAVRPAQGGAGTADRPGAVPGGQDLGAADGAGRAGTAGRRRHARDCAHSFARAGAGGARQGLRAPGQRLPWPVLPAGAGLFRPSGRGTRRGAGRTHAHSGPSAWASTSRTCAS